MNLSFWSRLSKKRKIQLGALSFLILIGVILMIVFILKPSADTTCPSGNICNQATATWTDTSGSHTSISNTVQTAITTSSTTTLKYSLQNVTSPNQNDNFTLKVYSGSTLVATSNLSGTDIGGNYGQGTVSLGIAAGTYDFQFKDATHLSVKKTGIVYNPSSPPTINFGVIKGGDINGDNTINTADYSPLISHWNTNDAASDINRDSRINGIDYSILITNWNQGGS